MDLMADENDKTGLIVGRRFKWVRGFFYAAAVGQFLMLVGSVMVFFMDFSNYNPDYDVSAADWTVGAGALIYLPAFLGSIIAFSMFTYRAMKNLHIWESRKVDMTPGWAVGWYFIPVANLWKPYQGMDEIWDGTHDVTSGKLVPASKMGLWWMFWIVSNISSNISNAIARRDGPIDLVMKSTAMVDVISMASGVLAVVMIIPILKSISEKQDGKVNAMVFE